MGSGGIDVAKQKKRSKFYHSPPKSSPAEALLCNRAAGVTGAHRHAASSPRLLPKLSPFTSLLFFPRKE